MPFARRPSFCFLRLQVPRVEAVPKAPEPRLAAAGPLAGGSGLLGGGEHALGHPLDDLAYALWLWLDLGNEEYSYATVRQRMGVMLDAYGVAAGERPGMGERIHRQMERVAQSVFPTPQQTAATSQWARRSQAWLRGFWNSLYPGRL